MSDLPDLARPLVAAPMAGGPSTPALVAAASAAGGLGLLAAGYLTPERLLSDVREVRALGAELFGVNVFVPEGRATDLDAVTAFRGALAPHAERLGVELPTALDIGDDDHYDAKVDVVEAERVPVVTFTFGVPSVEVVTRLHDVGTSVGITVTSRGDAAQAAPVGADWLCVQGPEAGGHRSTFDRDLDPPTQPLDDLLRDVQQVTDLPLVAAGGVASADRVAQLLGLGAVAVQVGSVLLRTDEAGTKPAYAAAIAAGTRDTVVTRAYSGRAARGLRNDFIDDLERVAVREYPAVNTLTGTLRRTAPDDPEVINLWAGTAYREARAESVAETFRRLA